MSNLALPLAVSWNTPFWGVFVVWQIPLFILLIAIVIFYMMYRRRQV